MSTKPEAHIDAAVDYRDRWHGVVQVQAEQLADKLRDQLQEILHQHRAATGWDPAAIRVRMIETTTLGSRRPEYIIGRVEIDPPKP
jgi:hypothetical protein